MMQDKKMSIVFQSVDMADVLEIRRTISLNRFITYIKATGHNQQSAVHLYLWNGMIGAAFHLPIQTVEVLLRNKVDQGFLAVYGAKWWTDSQFLKLLNTHHQSYAEKLSQLPDSQIVAQMPFGFWVHLLSGCYRDWVWHKHFNDCFPYIPNQHDFRSKVDGFQRDLRDINFLRNRIFHHEPLVHRNISADYSLVIKTIKVISPITLKVFKPYFKVAEVLRQKP